MDASARLGFGPLLSVVGQPSFSINVGVNNLLDHEPDYSNFNFGFAGYDPAQYDLLGRFAHIGFDARW